MTILFWILVALVGILGGICMGQYCTMENNKMLQSKLRKAEKEIYDLRHSTPVPTVNSLEWFLERIGILNATVKELREENAYLKTQIALNCELVTYYQRKALDLQFAKRVSRMTNRPIVTAVQGKWVDMPDRVPEHGTYFNPPEHFWGK